MTKTTEQDLRDKVKELLDDLEFSVGANIDELIACGSGVLEAHAAQDSNWVEPRKVFLACLKDAALGMENMLPPSMDKQAFKDDVENYYNLI